MNEKIQLFGGINSKLIISYASIIKQSKVAFLKNIINPITKSPIDSTFQHKMQKITTGEIKSSSLNEIK